MKKYLVKVAQTATEENVNFANAVYTHYYGKNDELLKTDDPNIWNAPKEFIPYFVEKYGYNRKCDAKRCWSYKNPENSKWWKSTASIVEVEI